jgi:hypothetical protein
VWKQKQSGVQPALQPTALACVAIAKSMQMKRTEKVKLTSKSFMLLAEHNLIKRVVSLAESGMVLQAVGDLYGPARC